MRGDVQISGTLSGTYTYRHQNVVTSGPVTLTGNTTITVYGGSISINHPVTCANANGSPWDGADGQDGTQPGLVAWPGNPGSSGWSLSLYTYRGATSEYPPRGVHITAGIDLHGGNGGRGGHGASAALDGCASLSAQAGAAGGQGGFGGNLLIRAYSTEGVYIGACIDTRGGRGGDGGRGGVGYDLPFPAHYSQPGGAGGAGATGGWIKIYQLAYEATGQPLGIDGCLVTMGGNGGNGGDGGHDGEWWDGSVGSQALGGPAGAGYDGGAILVSSAYNVVISGPTMGISTEGGRGGCGGSGSPSGRVYGTGDYGCPWCVDSSGAPGSPSPGKRGGRGGSVTILGYPDTAQQLPLIVRATIETYGGDGGCGGGGGAADTWRTCTNEVTCPTSGGAPGAEGGYGGSAGSVTVNNLSTNPAAQVQFWSAVNAWGGRGGDGGGGGYSAGCGGTCTEYPESEQVQLCGIIGGIGGRGGDGLYGGDGATVRVNGNGGVVDVTYAYVDVEGGDGGNGGAGGSADGSPGGGGPGGGNGSFALTAGQQVGEAQVSMDPGDDGDPGVPGDPNCVICDGTCDNYLCGY